MIRPGPVQQVYGSVFKKYLIENLDGEKVVSRSRGFTVDSCAAGISAAEEEHLGPEFQGIPARDKVCSGLEAETFVSSP